MRYNCTGCHIRNQCHKLNRHRVYKADICPCRICLVKGICNTPCEDYRILWRGYRGPTDRG